jgi:hypothetical protein
MKLIGGNCPRIAILSDLEKEDNMQLTRVQNDPKNPGEWLSVADKPNADAGFVKLFPIILCCPQCGKQCSVSTRNHEVVFHDDGTFTAHPSFVCPHPPCTWHVFIRKSQYFN